MRRINQGQGKGAENNTNGYCYPVRKIRSATRESAGGHRGSTIGGYQVRLSSGSDGILEICESVPTSKNTSPISVSSFEKSGSAVSFER